MSCAGQDSAPVFSPVSSAPRASSAKCDSQDENMTGEARKKPSAFEKGWAKLPGGSNTSA